MLALMVLVTIVATVCGAGLIWLQKRAAIAGLTSEAEHTADFLAKACARPLWSLDSHTIQGNLKAVMADPRIYSAEVAPGFEVKRNELKGDLIAFKFPIEYLDAGSVKNLGFARVVYSTYELQKRIFRVRLFVIVSVIILLALIGVVSHYLFGKLVRAPVAELVKMTSLIAKGEFHAAIPIESRDELGKLARVFAEMAEATETTLLEFEQAASELESEAVVVMTISSRQSGMINKQAVFLAETSASMLEITQTSKQASDEASSVIGIAERSEEITREGQESVEQVLLGLEKLVDQSEAMATTISRQVERSLQIGEIISKVRDVAEQSNVLALNASMEAARAGEQGLGLVVVAEEMRRLAEQTKQAANGVKAMLEEVLVHTRLSSEAAEKGAQMALQSVTKTQSAGSSIASLSYAIRESSRAARKIADNTQLETKGMEQIVTAIYDLTESNSSVAEGARRIERVASNLDIVARRLSGAVKRLDT